MSFDCDRHFSSVILPLPPSQILLRIPSFPLASSSRLIISFLVFSYLFLFFIHLNVAHLLMPTLVPSVLKQLNV